MTWRELALGAVELAGAWAAVIALAHLLAKLDGSGARLWRRMRRPSAATVLAQLPAEPLTPAEDRFARTLLEAAYAVPCPEDIAFFERSVEAMLQHRGAA